MVSQQYTASGFKGLKNNLDKDDRFRLENCPLLVADLIGSTPYPYGYGPNYTQISLWISSEKICVVKI